MNGYHRRNVPRIPNALALYWGAGDYHSLRSRYTCLVSTPERHILLLGGQVQVLEKNLPVATGTAEYGKPAIQPITQVE